MEKSTFKKLLFKVAFCTMACDGHIDEREVEEMKMINKNTSFFDDIDLSQELTWLISEFGNRGAQITNDLFETLKNSVLNPIQELIVLEVALRIINADHKHDENEIRFIHFLRAKLKIHDEVIVDRFGEIDILHTNPYIKSFVKEQNNENFTNTLSFPEIKNIEEIKFDL